MLGIFFSFFSFLSSLKEIRYAQIQISHLLSLPGLSYLIEVPHLVLVKHSCLIFEHVPYLYALHDYTDFTNSFLTKS